MQLARRLPAEFVRDNTLAVSGLLVPEIGGPSVKPFSPGILSPPQFPQACLQTGYTGIPNGGEGLYVHWQRQFLHPMMKAFDTPNP